MTPPTAHKSSRTKHASSSEAEKLLEAVFGEVLLPKKSNPELGQLSARWENARAQATSGKTGPLTLDKLKRWMMRFSSAELNELVIPKRTLARRRELGEPLTPEETDKALRLARISTEADRVFGDPEKSSRWLRKPNSAFSGQSPLALLKSETGAIAVSELLGQIDHGMVI